MRILRLFCWIILFSTAIIPTTHAQELTDTARLYRELAVLQNGYSGSPVSYDVRYIYASELHPDIVLDSMKGSVSIYNKACRYQLDNMETVANGSYNIVLFRQEKLMYIVKAVEGATPDPLDRVRKMLGNAGVQRYIIKEENHQKIIHINFLPEADCREMEVAMDERTGQLQTVKYVVKTALLMQTPAAMEDKVEAEYGSFAIVQESFFHYQPLTKVPDWLDAQHFFYKDGDELKTTPAYNEFKIFKGSPNL